jgi:hypothetical protein
MTPLRNKKSGKKHNDSRSRSRSPIDGRRAKGGHRRDGTISTSYAGQ